MSDTDSADLPEIVVPDGRDRLGRAHQLRVDIAITIALVPIWLKRTLVDRNDEKARGARAEIVERIAAAIERRFRLTWHGSSDESENALPASGAGILRRAGLGFDRRRHRSWR